MATSYQPTHPGTDKGFLVRHRVAFLFSAVLALTAIELIAFALGWHVSLRPHGPANFLDPYSWIGSLLVIAGVSCRSWAAATLVKSRQLATGGPYACCRHPLYLGSFLILLGYCTLLGQGQFLAVLVLVGTVLLTYPPTVLREERHLAELFPAAWPNYARVVPAFIPRKLPRSAGPVSWRQWLRNREYNAAVTSLLGLAGIQLWHWYVG